jgi:hypothetical protein
MILLQLYSTLPAFCSYAMQVGRGQVPLEVGAALLQMVGDLKPEARSVDFGLIKLLEAISTPLDAILGRMIHLHRAWTSNS